jgi:hypothetical protein
LREDDWVPDEDAFSCSFRGVERPLLDAHRPLSASFPCFLLRSAPGVDELVKNLNYDICANTNG